MRRHGLRLVAFLLLALLAGSTLGVLGVCPEGCDDPTDCGAFCFDCLCCPNGSATPGEPPTLTASLPPLEPAAGRIPASEPDELAAEILHVPRPVAI